MNTLKILKYEDLKDINQYEGKNCIINLEQCDIKLRRRVMDFFNGHMQSSGEIEKISKDKFIIKNKNA